MQRNKGTDIQSHHNDAGLILIQIDGFSKTELGKAIDRGEMPFLKKLIDQEQYRLSPLYTGLPSTTPAVQGELFYGVKQSVPSFFFFDKESQKVFRMFDGDSVRTMEQRLSKLGEGLLVGGSSYSNIYSGGAGETHFCAGMLGWRNVWKDVNAFQLIRICVTHFAAVVRMTVLCLWETVLALMDYVYGLLKREDFSVESKFVLLRVLICILLRELVTLGATMDTSRGLPVIHLNFLGFDEQAHRRGPSSKTAHWALKGIDRSIARIYAVAMRSRQRNYDVWVYSDHGQETTIPYVGLHGKSVDSAVEEIFHAHFDGKILVNERSSSDQRQTDSVQLHRARYLGEGIAKIWPLNPAPVSVGGRDVVVTAMGPLGGVYVFRDLSNKEKILFAQELVKSAQIPLVLMPEENGKVRAWNEHGEFVLPEQAEEVLGKGHPFLNDAAHDLMSLCHHPNAGTLTISGWKPNGQAMSFPFENGAHAGPGRLETDAFALLPAHVKIPTERPYLRTRDLRNLALKSLKRDHEQLSTAAVPHQYRPSGTVRIMTYNVHGCIGMDGKVSPARIAKVIACYEPDIVLLQELDVGRKRTGQMDQPHLIAKELGMMHHFHPSFHVEEEQYGNAVLSRYPMELVHAAKLPGLKNHFNGEPRGAMRVAVTVGDLKLHVINAHLSYYGREGRAQAAALIGPEWAGHPDYNGPLILGGDFNFLPNSNGWRSINQKLKDVQRDLTQHRPQATWFGHYPVGRIDHIFISQGITVAAIEVPRSQLNKISSDHLPLIADLEIF